MKRQQIKKIRDWGVALSYILLIYITLPVVPGLWAKFARYTGDLTKYLAALILALLACYLVFYLISKQKSIRNYIWLAVLVFAYAWGLSRLKLSIEEIHFIEYGLLSLLVFRALRHNIANKSVYFWSGLIVFCLGFLDEGIQYVLPNRVYEAKDVIVNGFAGILGLLLIGLCIEPALEDAHVK